MAKTKRNQKKTNTFLPLFLITLGSLFVTVSTIHSFLRLRSFTIDKATVESYMEEEVSSQTSDMTGFRPVHIYSQYFLDIDIEPAVYNDDRWTISSDKASYLLNSSLPGSDGNIIIYGHNKRKILGNIRAYKTGETVTLSLDNGTQKDYIVTELHEENPSNTVYLEPTDHEVLTMYTCSGFMDSKRFVVIALPK